MRLLDCILYTMLIATIIILSFMLWQRDNYIKPLTSRELVNMYFGVFVYKEELKPAPDYTSI